MDPITVIRREAGRVATVLAGVDPALPVPTCPEWTASDLLWHLGEVHWFWANVLARGATTEADVEQIEETKPARPESPAGLADFLNQSTHALAAQLAALGDDGSARSFMGGPTIGAQAFDDCGIRRSAQHDALQAEFRGHLRDTLMRNEERQAA